MPKPLPLDIDDDNDPIPLPAGRLSSNGQWLFGSIYAALTLVGFSFGVWAGASKTKPVEVAAVKKDSEKPAEKVALSATKPPVVTPPAELKAKDKEKEPEPLPKEKEPEPDPVPPAPKEKEPEPKPKAKEPDPKPKEPDPKPKPKTPEPKKGATKVVAFKEIEPVFRAYCNNCHGAAGKPKAGVDLRTAAAILKGNENGALVKPGDPENSPLYLSIKPPSGTMPPDGKPGPNEKELQLVRDWIMGGAKPRRTIRRRGTRAT